MTNTRKLVAYLNNSPFIVLQPVNRYHRRNLFPSHVQATATYLCINLYSPLGAQCVEAGSECAYELDFDIFIQSIFKFMTCTVCLRDASAGTGMRVICTANRGNATTLRSASLQPSRLVACVRSSNKEHVDQRNYSETIIIFWTNSFLFFFFSFFVFPLLLIALQHTMFRRCIIIFFRSLFSPYGRHEVLCLWIVESRRRRFTIEFSFSVFQ